MAGCSVSSMGLNNTTLNYVFSVTYYLELQNTIFSFTIDVNFYQVKLSMFYDVQITNVTFVGRREMRYIIKK